jgi:hypothetical protein
VATVLSPAVDGIGGGGLSEAEREAEGGDEVVRHATGGGASCVSV